MKMMQQGKFFLTFTGCTVDNQNRNVGLIQYLIAFADAKCTKFSFIVNPGSVNDHDRTKRQKLHGLIYGVSCCTPDRRNDGEILPGHGIDNA